MCLFFFFFQAEDGIRDIGVTGVQTCALPIYDWPDSFWNYDLESGHPAHPVLRDDFDDDAVGVSSLFEFRWIATASEAREFRDLSRLIGQRMPTEIGTHGWVRDFVVIDYMLLYSNGTVGSR